MFCGCCPVLSSTHRVRGHQEIKHRPLSTAAAQGVDLALKSGQDRPCGFHAVAVLKANGHRVDLPENEQEAARLVRRMEAGDFDHDPA